MKCFSFTSSSPADNGSTLSSEAITDSATSTDNNYGYMGMDKNANTHAQTHFSGPPLSLVHLSPQLGLQLASCEQHLSLTGCLCVSLFIRTGAFQTPPNPQSPSPHSHPHW